MHRKTVSIALVLLAVVSLSACSGLSTVRGMLGNNGDVDYQNNQAVKKLEIPPDLTKPEFDNAFDLPTGVISAVSINNGTAIKKSQVSSGASNNTGSVRSGDLSSVKTVAGKTVLQINDTYSRSLVLTEIMLTRMGFATLSKSPEGNVITAKYNGEDVAVSDEKSSSWLGKFKNVVTFGSERRKLESNKALISGETYRVNISNKQGSPVVTFSRANGNSISDVAHAKIITLLNSKFNS